jgi:hypothetical protein
MKKSFGLGALVVAPAVPGAADAARFTGVGA